MHTYGPKTFGKPRHVKFHYQGRMSRALFITNELENQKQNILISQPYQILSIILLIVFSYEAILSRETHR